VRIEVRLFATFAAYLPPESRDGAATLEVPEGATVADVARALGISSTLARVSLVNGRETAPDHPLMRSDIVDLFPPLAGG
jgi:molybdopterin converting factor small subunit